MVGSAVPGIVVNGLRVVGKFVRTIGAWVVGEFVTITGGRVAGANDSGTAVMGAAVTGAAVTGAAVTRGVGRVVFRDDDGAFVVGEGSGKATIIIQASPILL